MSGIIQSMTGAIDKMPVLGNKGFIGKHLFFAGQTNQNFGKDAVSWLKNTPSTNGFFNKLFRFMFPAPIRPMLARAVNGFRQIPLMNRISIWAQWGLGFDAVTGVYSGLKDTFTGYQKSTGSATQKAANGVKSGIKSIMQTALLMGATLVGAYALPALLGASVLNASGIILGVVGSSVLHGQMEKLLGRDKETLEKKAALEKAPLIPKEVMALMPAANAVITNLPPPMMPIAQPLGQNVPNPFMYK
jgi:hypothetical protein